MNWKHPEEVLRFKLLASNTTPHCWYCRHYWRDQVMRPGNHDENKGVYVPDWCGKHYKNPKQEPTGLCDQFHPAKNAIEEANRDKL